MPRTSPEPIGWLDQWVDWQINALPPSTLATLTADAGWADAVSTTPHGFLSLDEVEIAGAADAAFNGRFIVTVSDAFAFRYRVLATAPATTSGTITATYLGDGMGGRRDTWTTQQRLAAEVRAVSGLERIQAQAIQAEVLYRVRVWRAAISAQHRLLWDDGITGVLTLQIVAVLRIGTSFLIIDCTEGKAD